jgi:ABC-type phosphate transport system substrate-binding protein
MLCRLQALALAVALLAPSTGTLGGAERFRVVVNPSVTVRALTREDVARFFLGKAAEWPDGTRVRPIEQRQGSEIREAFTRDVLRRSTAAVKAQWQHLVFSGRGVPPPEAVSDAAVLAHVRAHPGGIGYVSAGGRLEGVVELELER